MSNHLENTSTMRAVGLARMIPVGFVSIIKGISFFVLAAGLFLTVVCALIDRLGPGFTGLLLPAPLRAIDRDLLLGLVCVFASLWALCTVVLGFLRQKLMRMGCHLGKTADAQMNLAECLDFRAARLLEKIKTLDHLPLGKLLLYYLLSSNYLAFTMQRLSVARSDLKAKLLDGMKDRSRNFSRDDVNQMKENNRLALDQLLAAAAAIATKNGHDRITIFDLFLAVSDRDENFQKMMDDLELNREDIELVVFWQMNMESYRDFRRRFWERDNLRIYFSASPVQELIGGYTITLDRYARDVAVYNPLRQGGVVLHQNEIEQLEEALVKEKSNGVLLVGETGSGRKSIVYNFANRVASENSSSALKFLRILEIDITAVAAANHDPALFEGALKQIFNEAVKAKNVVLVLPQIHNYIGLRGKADAASPDISGALSEFLARPGFRLIGIATPDGFHKFIERVPEVSERFRKIEVSTIDTNDAIRVLKEESLRREKTNRVFVPIVTLKEIVKLCDYFLTDTQFPLKAIDILDDLIANKESSGSSRQKVILPAEVDAFFSRKYDVPAGAAGKEEKEILLNLEERIHKGLVNQKEAVSELANALRRCRADIKKRNRTIGNFLFLGPTGCGKTETAKQLAKAYFGSAKNMIRLDMAEYQTVESIGKLIGDNQAPGYLTTAIRQTPFSLILIDEIEKAHRGLLNIFLGVFDEGRMNDGNGKPVDFRHAIIIATSNAGAEYIKEAIDRGQTLTDFKDQFIDYILKKAVFSPEFINRFDGVVLYRSLAQDEMETVALLMLNDIRDNLAQKRIELIITQELVKSLARLGFDPVFGGRAMRRVIQDKIENPLAKALLSGAVRRGARLQIDANTWEVAVV